MDIGERSVMREFSEEELAKVEVWLSIFQDRKTLTPNISPVNIKLKPKPSLPSINISSTQYKNLINFA